jgi:hypothetical protein
MAMKIYTVHYRHEDAGSLAGLAERAVLVKEGFSWSALLIGPIWLAWRGMWLVLAFYVAAMIILAAIVRLLGLPDGVASVVAVAINLLVAMEGNGLWRWSLDRRRYKERAVTTGSSLAEAEERFFIGCPALQRVVSEGQSLP